jgi:predicted nucleic acid-binding protein
MILSLIGWKPMKGAESFFDTNVLLYLLSSDSAKADQAEALLAAGGVVSVQVLNEFASVAFRKLAMNIPDIQSILSTVRAVCVVKTLDVETHELGLDVAKRYGFSIYDSMIVAAALRAQCTTLCTEDLQQGQVIDRLTIRNPFAGGR